MPRRSAIATVALIAALHAPGAGAQATLTDASACLNQATRLQQQLETRVTGPLERRDAIRLLWRARDHAESGDAGSCQQAIAEARERLAGAEPGPGRSARQDPAGSAQIPPDARPETTRGVTSGATGEGPQSIGSLVHGAGLDDIGGAKVANEAGQRLGEVTRVVQSTDGTEILLVVGVGGFLGLGDREVALPLSAFQSGDQTLVLPGHDRQSLDRQPPYDSDRYSELDVRDILKKTGP